MYNYRGSQMGMQIETALCNQAHFQRNFLGKDKGCITLGDAPGETWGLIFSRVLRGENLNNSRQRLRLVNFFIDLNSINFFRAGNHVAFHC